jgi:hypothetical protein
MILKFELKSFQINLKLDLFMYLMLGLLNILLNFYLVRITFSFSNVFTTFLLFTFSLEFAPFFFFFPQQELSN